MLFNRAKFPASPIANQRGIIVPLFAAFSTLLVLLLLGWCIDLPTHQASVVRSQFSADVSNATGLTKYWDPPVVASSTNSISAAANYGSYSGSPGLFFRQVEQNAIGIPEQVFSSVTASGLSGALCTNAIGATPSCDTGSNATANLEIFKTDQDPYFSGPGGTDDDGGNPTAASFSSLTKKYFNLNIQDNGVSRTIADFRNGLVQYNHLQPFSYFNFLTTPQKNVSTVSAVRLINTAIGIVVDTAMPLGDEDANLSPTHVPTYYHVFDSDPAMSKVTNDYNFPTAAYRKIPVLNTALERANLKPKDIIYPDVYPDDPSSQWSQYGYWVTQRMGGGIDIPFSVDPSGWKPLTDSNFPAELYTKVFNFFTATCDSLPFFFYKSSAVSLIDRLAKTSAYSPTTLVGLTGYEPRNDSTPTTKLNDAVIPIFPSTIPVGASAAEAYERFVPAANYPLQINNPSGDIYLHNRKSTAFRGWVTPNQTFNTVGLPVWQKSRPELLYCSEYYRAGKDLSLVDPEVTGPVLPDDFSYSSVDAAGFNHANLSSQRRSSPAENGFVSHWYDDTYVQNTPPRDVNTSLGLHHSGTNGANDGETPRNLVGLQAMRLANYNFDKLDAQFADPNSWERPDPAQVTGAPLTGFSYLPYAIQSMCDQVKNISNSYNQDPTYGAVRPIQQTSVIVYGFQLASKTALDYLGKDLSTATDDFRTAVQSCLCQNPNMKMIFALLPMDTESGQQIDRMKNVLYDFERAHNGQCVGVPSDMCSNDPQGSVFSLVYDWRSTRFGGGTNNPHEEARAHLAAAKAFFSEVSETATKLLIQWVYEG